MFKLFRSVKDEILVPMEGDIVGELPPWLSGSVYRNGPGLFEFGNTKYFHWFDGMSVIQRFHIQAGKVTYQRRFLQSETYKSNLAANRIIVSEFGTRAYPDPQKNSLSQMFSKLKAPISDNCPINIVKLGKELFAVSETNYLHGFDPITLETKERLDITDLIDVKQASANAHYDETGTLHNIGYSYGLSTPKYCFFTLTPRTDDESKHTGEIIASLDIENKFHPSYIHSFCMTENYYIYIEQPLVINVWKILSAEFRQLAMFECLEWRKDLKARFHVIKRKTGEEVNPDFIYQASPFLMINQGNAFEKDGHIIVDTCAFEDRSVLDSYFLNNLTYTDPNTASEGNFPNSSYQRYILPLTVDLKSKSIGNDLLLLETTQALAILTEDKTIDLIPEQICNISFELPVINYKYNGTDYRYVYGVTYESTPKFSSSLLKFDLHTKISTFWHEKDCFPSQVMFVSSPDGSSEDDGVLISSVNTTDDLKRCFLLILNAKTMEEICRVTFPVWIPRDLHGLFINEN